MSKIEDAVIQQIINRANAGQKKYGMTMERKDLSFIDWLNHLQQELLDVAIYIEKIKDEQESSLDKVMKEIDKAGLYKADL